MSKSLKLFGGTALGTLAVLTMAVNFADRNIAGFPENPPVMTAIAPPVVSSGLVAAANASTGAGEGKFGLGRPALAEEIAAWDLDVSPDGTGLPVGSGSVEDGEMIFSENCAVCHGEFAEGVDNWPELAGGEGTLADADPVKTVGSYWPYLSTAWDYVHRSMPYGNAQTLSNDEVYAIVAYILYSNFLVDDDFVLSNENFLDVEMPNANGFIVDDRAETEYTIWRTEPCMENCKDSVEITMRATVLDVTPEEEGDDHASGEMSGNGDAVVQTAAAAPVAETAEPAPVVAAAAAGPDPELVASGEKVFGKCKACHQVGDGAKNRSGPALNGVVGADIASVDGFKYSNVLADMEGAWTPETLAAFLADPRGFAKGTKMSFAGLKSEDDIAAVTAYLSTFEK
ncbi:MAG: c-type cytochrome [Marivita sp.]|uniref:c-type cytochrome n=1 Tax=Marivita sp. TaxID=2003365 RepID=UPI0025C528D1|nr:c-type cytochrome [Marivita sp.]MCI5112567.1 c-type cytochrome [Marivita sp.]